MKPKKLLIGTGVAAVLITSGAGVASAAELDTGERQMRFRPAIRHELSQADKEAIKSALENNDYNAFIAAHGEDSRIAEKMTEERFATLVEKFENGEFPGKRHRLRKQMRERFSEDQMTAIKAAIEDRDFNAFVAAHSDDARILEVVTEDNFDQFVDMHELRMSGDRDGARAIAEELGLFRAKRIQQQ